MHDSHVKAWLLWYQREGRHFDNSLRHPTQQLSNPPINAQGLRARITSQGFA